MNSSPGEKESIRTVLLQDHIEQNTSEHDKNVAAGLLRNSQGLGLLSAGFCPLILSIIPEILQYPPKGNQPIPYSVCEF